MEEIPDISVVEPKLLRDPVFQQLMAEGLAIQDRFSAEPVYARTGKGYLKPTGVQEIREARAEPVSSGKLFERCMSNRND